MRLHKLSQAQRDALREFANLKRWDVETLCANMGSEENPRPFIADELGRALYGKGVARRTFDWLCGWIEEHLRVRSSIILPPTKERAQPRLGARDYASGERRE